MAAGKRRKQRPRRPPSEIALRRAEANVEKLRQLDRYWERLQAAKKRVAEGRKPHLDYTGPSLAKIVVSWNWRDVSDAIGCHYNTVRTWFHGRAEPSFSYGLRLAWFLDIPVERLEDWLALQRKRRREEEKADRGEHE